MEKKEITTEVNEEIFRAYRHICGGRPPEDIKKALELLDLEKQGLLMKLPCKPYTTVYEIQYKYDSKNDCFTKIIKELTLVRYGKNQYNDYAVLAVLKDEYSEYVVTLGQFGKTVFLIKKDAEKILEMKNENIRIN